MKNSAIDEKRRKWNARKKRTNKAVARADKPVVKVFRSAKHIYAQILDPESGKTLGGVSTRSPSVVAEGNTGNIDAAKKVGTALAALAREKQIDRVVFNRNGFLYHGRVKALAEAAREAGLQF
ncbi:MAG: 50S ribosomal protein L18 [Myxococcota bacterium]|nr:50S ribosomal protein L18 [Myxococcota bacterium]